MFTGIIRAIGSLKRIEQKDHDQTLLFDAGKLDLVDVAVSDSICVNGVCLTVVAKVDGGLLMDVSNETLACTNLGLLQEGAAVNLEQALQLGERLDGHLVSGHVDGTGTIASITQDDRSIRFVIETPQELMKYIAVKGSICIDGVSLTVNKVSDTTFEVNIIPHTLQETILDSYSKGSRVNLEVDLVARYLEGLVNRA